MHSKAENDFLTDQSRARFGGVSLWLGGVRINNSFTWSDKTSFNTTFWAPLQPTGSINENCLHMSADFFGQWNDNSCDLQLRYACKLGGGKSRDDFPFLSGLKSPQFPASNGAASIIARKPGDENPFAESYLFF